MPLYHPLTLSDLDDTGLEVFVKALITAPNPISNNILFGQTPRPVAGTLNAGELLFDDANIASRINQIRLFSDNLQIRKNTNTWTSFVNYFSATGDGANVVLTIQTADGSVDIDTVDNIYGNAAPSAIRFAVSATTDPDDIISGITNGTQFIIRFAQPEVVVVTVPATTINLGSVSATLADVEIDQPDVEVTGLSASLTVSIAVDNVEIEEAVTGSQTISVPVASVVNQFIIIWDLTVGNYIPLDSSFSQGNVDIFFGYLSMNLGVGSVNLRFAPSQVLNENLANPDLSDSFEASGSIVIEASDGETLTLTGITDSTEPYAWTPSNSADVIAFGTHVVSLTDTSIDITFSEEEAAEATVVPALSVDLGTVSAVLDSVEIENPDIEVLGISITLGTVSTVLDNVQVLLVIVPPVIVNLGTVSIATSVPDVDQPDVETSASATLGTVSIVLDSVEIAAIPSVTVPAISITLGTVSLAVTVPEVDQPDVETSVTAALGTITVTTVQPTVLDAIGLNSLDDTGLEVLVKGLFTAPSSISASIIFGQPPRTAVGSLDAGELSVR